MASTQIRSRSGWTPRRRTNLIKGLLFISPWVFGVLVFTVYPIAASLYYSFTDYDVFLPPRPNGLENYVEAFSLDDLFGRTLYNTVWFVVLGVPSQLVIAFVLANLLNTTIRFRSVFRTIFYLPTIVPAVASAFLWKWLFNVRVGLFNHIIVGLGFQRAPWLSDPVWAKPSLLLIHWWACGAAMVIFLAALQDVPGSLYDAAKVDGAGTWRRFWHITIPLCTPAILFNLIMGVIATFQAFDFVWILTEGGPNYATEFYGLYLYRNAFRYFRMGYASAMAWILFLIIVACTVALFRSSARWVFYGRD
jgi:multiple sugar transport system permease protein